MRFAEAYESGNMDTATVVAAMSVIVFGAMCRYDDASGQMWRNIRFETDEGSFEITFDKSKNSLFRQGNKVLGAPLIPLRFSLPSAASATIGDYNRRSGGTLRLPRIQRHVSIKESGQRCPGTH